MTQLVQLLKAISETSYVSYMGKPFNLDIAIFEIESMQQQIANLNSNIEAQEIMLRDKDMWIRGLEAELKRLKSECDWRDV